MNANEFVISQVVAPMHGDQYGRPLCARCGKPVDTTESGHYSLVTGWAQNRDGGGAHGITLRRDHGTWKHKLCFQKDQLGGQEAFF